MRFERCLLRSSAMTPGYIAPILLPRLLISLCYAEDMSYHASHDLSTSRSAHRVRGAMTRFGVDPKFSGRRILNLWQLGFGKTTFLKRPNLASPIGVSITTGIVTYGL